MILLVLLLLLLLLLLIIIAIVMNSKQEQQQQQQQQPPRSPLQPQQPPWLQPQQQDFFVPSRCIYFLYFYLLLFCYFLSTITIKHQGNLLLIIQITLITTNKRKKEQWPRSHGSLGGRAPQLETALIQAYLYKTKLSTNKSTTPNLAIIHQ